jgi:hypothetical protein
MLAAAKVRPLEDFFEPIFYPPPPEIGKETALSIRKGSIFCLCDAPQETSPEVLACYHVEDLRIVGDGAVRWTLFGDDGRWHEGASQEIDLYRGLLLMRPTNPLKSRVELHGLNVVFHFRLPQQYRIHHLAYLRRNFPESVAELQPSLQAA